MLDKKHTMLCRMIPTDATPEEEAAWQVRVDRFAFDYQSYWRYYNRHHWDMQCQGYVLRYDGLCDPPSVVFGKGWAQERIDQHIAETDMQGFDPNFWYAWGKTSKHYCGLAPLGGYRAMINGQLGDCGIGTVTHEGGHNHGLWHSGLLREDGSTREYGDDTCIMGGGGPTQKGLNSPNMCKLNLDTVMERTIVDSTRQLLMCPIELPYHAQHPEETQHVVLRVAGHDDIYVSLRKTKGFRFPVHKRYEGTLFAHILESDGRVKRIEPDMKIGDDPWELPNGVIIQYHEYFNETGRVSFYFDKVDYIQRAALKDKSMPTGLPKPLPSSTLLPTHNGAWFNRDFDGQGLDVHIHGDDHEQEMVLYWYTANQWDDGLRYYIGHMPKGQGIREFTLYTTEGGTWDDPTTLKRIEVGEGMIEFYDTKRAVFHYRTDEFGRGAIELTPVAPLTTHELNGAWYQQSLDGSGFTVQVFPTGQISMFWFTFDQHGNQLWFSCQGQTFEDNEYVMDIYEVQGMNWMYFTQSETVPVGSALVRFLSDKTAQFEYMINSKHIADEGFQTLERLF